jgi:16S rRNA (guanine966-N2)-methyltransferase
MRVIAGRLRGRRIEAPKGALVRPTYDRVRESVFDILGPRVEGARVLDLFAGSGALGIECLSRGAESVTFVEKDRWALGVLRANVETLGVSAAATVLHGNAVRLLEGRVVPGGPFDLVFVDPPYASGLAALALALLSTRADLAPGALVVVEHARGEAPEAGGGALARTRTERYGTTEVSFFRIPN